MVCKQTKRNNPFGKKKQKNKRNSLLFCSLKQNFVPLDKVFALCKSKINEFILCFALVFVTLDKLFALGKSKINEFILCFALVLVTLHPI